MARALLLLAVLFLATASLALNLDLSIDQTTGAFKVLLDGTSWLVSGDVGFYSSQWISTAANDSTLSMISRQEGASLDRLGAYHYTSFIWLSPQRQPMVTTLKQYHDFAGVVFEQSFPQGLASTANVQGDTSVTGILDVCTAFPSFVLSSPANMPINYLNYYGYDLVSTGLGHWSTNGGYTGSSIGGSPLILYNSSLTAVVISPLSNFMTSIFSANSHFGPQQVVCGVNGKAASIPVGYSLSTILVAGQGVSDTMQLWGALLLREYSKSPADLYCNHMQRYLGYVTGNGAMYYYNLAPNTTNYMQTMLAVESSFVAQNIPVTWYEFDSWFYYRNSTIYNDTGLGGLTLWEPMPDVFPGGNMTFLGPKKELWLHNRYVDPYNLYRHNYTFITEPGTLFCVLPVDVNYYLHIMSIAKNQWNMGVFEQDWMAAVLMNMNVTSADLTAAMNWTTAMDSAALQLNVHLMWDSPLACQVMASVQHKSVVQGSSMMDYNPGNSQWKNGWTNMLFWSVGLVPWKDTFYTANFTAGCAYESCVEPNAELQVLISILTGGPTALGDAINNSNRTLVMQTCRTDGYLLKPDQPAVYLDATYQWSFVDLLPRTVFRTLSTYSIDGIDYTWHYIVSANLTAALSITPSNLGSPFLQTEYYFDWHNPAGTLRQFSESSPLQLPANVIPPPNNATSVNCTFAPCWQTIDWRYYVAAPLLWNRFVILGELSKFVPMSTQRFQKISMISESLELEIVGVPHEVVDITVMQPQGKLQVANCVLSGLGEARATCSLLSCSCF